MLQCPMEHINTMESAKIMEDVDTMATNTITADEEDAAHKKNGNCRGGCGGRSNSNLTH